MARSFGAEDGGMDGGMTTSLSAGSYPTSIAGTVIVPFNGSLDLETGSYDQLSAAKFPSSAWAPTFRAQLLLGEFGKTNWFGSKALLDRLKAIAEQPKTDDVLQLIGDVHLRNARMAEIFAQADDFSPYWANMLMVTPGSRPKTWLMITAMMLIGTMVSMKYKYEFSASRPVQVYPALMPVIQTPGHPSFPSGHALQCYLIADCLKRANPALGQAAESLAERIARNREIAGVHFPRDRHGSRLIATDLQRVLYDGPGIMKDLVDGIRKEYLGAEKKKPPSQNPVPETA